MQWIDRWQVFRLELNMKKEELCKKVKRCMLAKRMLVIEKMTVFVKKLKDIYKYIKDKQRRLEAALYISIMAHVKLRR